MNSKLWIRKALSSCLLVATIATYSMVALAGSEKIAGELLVNGNSVNGDAPSVKVNGEIAQSGRSIFSSSTIATPENASAIISLGKVGKIELAPNTTLALSFGENGIDGNLLAGRLTVLSASNAVKVLTSEGNTVNLNAGDSATSGKPQDDDDDDDDGFFNSSAGIITAVVVGGAIAAIIIASRSDNNTVSIGGGTTIVSPVR